MGPAPIGERGDVAMFTDLDGNVIGLFAGTERRAP